MTALRLSGDVVDRQTFLNGNRYLLIEGVTQAAECEWMWTLALTLPKAASASVEEGDFFLSRTGVEWNADVIGGRYAGEDDDTSGSEPLIFELELRVREDGEPPPLWSHGRLQARLTGEGLDGEIELS